jgi:hypothetical protein
MAGISATSCATRVIYATDYCLHAAPIYGSVEDTDETLEQIGKHNAKWIELCRE